MRWELIVVNDGGPRPCVDVAAETYPNVPLRVIDVPQGGPAAARNTGASVATGEYLALTDDDCMAEPEWLSAFARGLAETGADALEAERFFPNGPGSGCVRRSSSSSSSLRINAAPRAIRC